MTIVQLKCFVAVAKELNFAKAAAQLYISQPAVTQHIQGLEKELGVQLFYRTARIVKLTAAGELLLGDAEDILSRLERTTQRLAKSLEDETINIGCSSSLVLRNLPAFFRKYKELRPNTQINMIPFSVGEIRKFLEDELVDVAMAPKELLPRVPGYRYKRIKQGKIYCVVGKQHRFAGRSSVSFEDLAGETLIMLSNQKCPPMMQRVQQMIRERCPDILISTSGAAMFTIPMIVGGLGIAVMPEFVVTDRAELELIPFELEKTIMDEFEYGVIFPSGEIPAKTRTFLNVVEHLDC